MPSRHAAPTVAAGGASSQNKPSNSRSTGSLRRNKLPTMSMVYSQDGLVARSRGVCPMLARTASDGVTASTSLAGRVHGISSQISVIGPSVPDNVPGSGPLDDG